jgi:hypothetical protein
MPQAKPNRSFARAAMMVACGVFLILATGIGASYAADDEDMLPDEKFMRDFLRKLGLRNGQEAGIQYQERPPLVIPPSRDLPPPGVNSPLPKNAAWPDDPDIKRQKAEKKAKADRRAIDWNRDIQQDRMTPEQREAGRTGADGKTDTSAPARLGASPAGGGGNSELSPAELGYKGGLWSEFLDFTNIKQKPEVAPFTREPARTTLTEPPSGYRTPSPSQPYGVFTKDNGVGAKGQQDPQTVRGNQ